MTYRYRNLRQRHRIIMAPRTRILALGFVFFEVIETSLSRLHRARVVLRIFSVYHSSHTKREIFTSWNLDLGFLLSLFPLSRKKKTSTLQSSSSNNNFVHNQNIIHSVRIVYHFISQVCSYLRKNHLFLQNNKKQIKQMNTFGHSFIHRLN